MAFRELLRDRQETIVARWFEEALAVYPEDGSVMFGRRKNRFANPVGHSLRVGMLGIFEALLNGEDDEEKVREHLHEIIKIRAVQELPVSRAVGFVFRLKEVIRAMLAEADGASKYSAELLKVEDWIDRMALVAFDVFVQCRERVCELRVGEAKRKVSWVMDKMNERGFDPELSRIKLG